MNAFSLILFLALLTSLTNSFTFHHSPTTPTRSVILSSQPCARNIGRPPLTFTPFATKLEAKKKRPDPPPQRERVKKVKDDVIEVEGVVTESLPNAMFRVSIDNMDVIVLATIS